MRQIPINLYGEQRTILDDWLNTDKHCIDIIHAGSGKTFLASVFLPIAASDPKYHKGKDILYVAPTMGMISSLIWESLKSRMLIIILGLILVQVI
jgi:replicative superfamily II helicase